MQQQITVCVYIYYPSRRLRAKILRFRLESRLGLQTSSLFCLGACFFDRFPRGSRSPGSDGCSPVCVRVSESRATDERGDPELKGRLLGRGDTEVQFSSVLEICSAVVLKASRAARVEISRVLRI